MYICSDVTHFHTKAVPELAKLSQSAVLAGARIDEVTERCRMMVMSIPPCYAKCARLLVRPSCLIVFADAAACRGPGPPSR